MKANPAAVYVRSLVMGLRVLAQKYPARTISLTVSAIVFMAARFGVVLPELSVLHAVEIVLPVLVGGEVTHRNVSPANPPAK